MHVYLVILALLQPCDLIVPLTRLLPPLPVDDSPRYLLLIVTLPHHPLLSLSIFHLHSCWLVTCLLFPYLPLRCWLPIPCCVLLPPNCSPVPAVASGAELVLRHCPDLACRWLTAHRGLAVRRRGHVRRVHPALAHGSREENPVGRAGGDG